MTTLVTAIEKITAGLARLPLAFFRHLQPLVARLEKFRLVRWLGLAYFRLGELTAVKTLAAYPEVISIYTSTVYDKDFSVAHSDIDLFLVIKEKDYETGFRFLTKTYPRLLRRLTIFFPFIRESDTSLIFEENFFLYENLSAGLATKRKRQTERWRLVAGRELRQLSEGRKQKRTDYFFRRFYEYLSFQLFTWWGNEDVPLRQSVRQLVNILDTVCQLKGKNSDSTTYSEFLLRAGAPEKFIEEFQRRQLFAGRGSYRFILEIYYYALRLGETLERAPMSSKVEVEFIDVEGLIKALEPATLESARAYCTALEKDSVDTIFITPDRYRTIKGLELTIVINIADLGFSDFERFFSSVVGSVEKLPDFSRFVSFVRETEEHRRFIYWGTERLLPPFVITQSLLDSGYLQSAINFPARDQINLAAISLWGAGPELASKQAADYWSFLYFPFGQNWTFKALSLPKVEAPIRLRAACDYRLFADHGVIGLTTEASWRLWEKYYGEFTIQDDDTFAMYVFIREAMRSENLRNKIICRLGADHLTNL